MIRDLAEPLELIPEDRVVVQNLHGGAGGAGAEKLRQQCCRGAALRLLQAPEHIMQREEVGGLSL